MKALKPFVLLILLLFTGTIAEAQSKGKLKKQQGYEATKKIVERGRFIFETTILITRDAERLQTLGEGFLIYDNRIDVNFPFIGEMNKGTLSASQNIQFTAPYVETKVESNDKKRKILFTFEVKDGAESYDFSFTIYGNRRAKARIASSSRGRIEFEGTIKSNEQKL